MTAKLITVGKILAAHGIKGQVKIDVQSNNPLRFRRGHLLFVEKLQKQLKITAVQEHKSCLLLTLQGVDDRNQAEALAGSLLQVEESDLPKLPEGEYYYYQIEGIKVFDAEQGMLIGEVEEVLDYTANDVFVIRREGKRPLLLPALKSTVNRLDIEGGKMFVIIPEGLED